MRAVIQRVKSSSVTVEGRVISRTGPGLLVLLGVAAEDEQKDLDYLLEKIPNLRIFEDGAGKMNLSLADTGGEMMVVSQFTLLADTRKGRRPSFVKAAPPEKGIAYYEAFLAGLKQQGVPVQGGRFQAHMEVALVNDGPVTIVLDSAER
ncbi:MAG: D-aminoacyl-tRNA deacylase [Peptococcaceae bacterium]|nr:D-aminoacyl-tRNA deacylase [Peptococcaceae bacterium]